MKKLLTFILVVGLASASGYAAWYYKNLEAEQPQELVLYGNVDQRQVDLAFLDSERVAEVLVEEGSFVKEGQVLARLETRRLEDKIAVLEAQLVAARASLTKLENGTRPEEITRAKAGLEAARASFVFAEQQYTRAKNLWGNSQGSAVRKQDVEKSLAEYNAAKAQVAIEENNVKLAELGPRAEDIAEVKAMVLERERTLEQARHQLEDAELKSPIEAIVNKRFLEEGDIASPQRAVFSLLISSPKWVRAYINGDDLGRVQHGMEAKVYNDSYPDAPIIGTVGFISSVAEFTPKTVETSELRTSLVYEVRIYVDDEENILRLGMPVTVKF